MIAFALLFILSATVFAVEIDSKTFSASPSLGPATAPVTAYLFYDFQCPHCAKAAPVVVAVKKEFGDTVRLVAVNVPTPGHAYASVAAETALTANEQGKFWEAFKLLFDRQSELTPDNLMKWAKEIGVDPNQVEKNIQEKVYRGQLKKNFYGALDAGLKATPTLIVGDQEIVGAKSADEYKWYFNQALAAKGVKSPVGDVPKPGDQAEEKAFEVPKNMIYAVKPMKPVDSKLKVAEGQKAPDFTLPTVSGEKVSLSDYLGKKNVVISFVPAAWTPVCSAQWPTYNENKAVFDEHDAVMIGISADNVPSLYSWCGTMGELWFPVASDFYPHGEAAKRYGILRNDGVTERALFIVDKKGVIRYIDVHDINTMPNFDVLKSELEKLDQ